MNDFESGPKKLPTRRPRSSPIIKLLVVSVFVLLALLVIVSWIKFRRRQECAKLADYAACPGDSCEPIDSFQCMSLLGIAQPTPDLAPDSAPDLSLIHI